MDVSYYDSILETAPRNYIGWLDLQDIYLEDIIEKHYNLAYGKVQNENIGYIRIRNFREEVAYDLVDLLLEKYDDLDGIIVDVRNNSGGAELKGREIASRFTVKKILIDIPKSKRVVKEIT